MLPKGAAKGKAVQVRFTAEDFKRVTGAAKAKKMSVSEWIRSTLEANLNA
jgi:predicted HicB family RNase H-like nuclease